MGDPLPISSEPLWEIVERSAFLEERLGGDFLPETRAEDSEVIDKRMAAWRKNCAKGDEKVFRQASPVGRAGCGSRPGLGGASPAGKPRVAALGAVAGADDRVLPGTLGRSAAEERPGFHSGGAARRL